MQIWFRGIAAVLLGAVLGGALNMFVIVQGGALIDLPEGVDPGDPASLVANMHRFGPEHFAPPLLAHALGSLLGAFVAALVAAAHRMRFALGVSAFFLLGGIANAVALPAPAWFIALDLIAAYLPMGWLGGRLALRLRGTPAAAA